VVQQHAATGAADAGHAAGKVERLLCFKLDRLGRSLAHLAMILDEMNKLADPLICIGQGIDTSTDSPAGRLQLNVLMAVAEFRAGIIKERVNAGLKAAKGRGVRLGRPGTLVKRAEEVLALQETRIGLRAISANWACRHRLCIPSCTPSHIAAVTEEGRLTSEGTICCHLTNTLTLT